MLVSACFGLVRKSGIDYYQPSIRNISNHTTLQIKLQHYKQNIPSHTLVVKIIDVVVFPTGFMSARLYAGVFGAPLAAA